MNTGDYMNKTIIKDKLNLARERITKNTRRIAKKHMGRAVKLRGCHWPRDHREEDLKVERVGCTEGEHHWFCVQCPVKYGGPGCKKLRSVEHGMKWTATTGRRVGTFLFLVRGTEKLDGMELLNGFVIYEKDEGDRR